MATPTFRTELRLLEQVKLNKIITVTLNQEALDRNTQIFTECLKKLSTVMQEFSGLKELTQQLSGQVQECKSKISSLSKQNGALRERQKQNEETLEKFRSGKALQGIYQKLDQLNIKCDISINNSKTFDISDILTKIQGLEKFVRLPDFDKALSQQAQQNKSIQEMVSSKVQSSHFVQFQKQVGDDLDIQKSALEKTQEQQASIKSKVGVLQFQTSNTKKELGQNNGLLKELSVKQSDDVIGKLKHEFRTDVQDLNNKLKRKAATSDLNSLEDKMVQKMDKYLKGLSGQFTHKGEFHMLLHNFEKKIELVERSANKSKEQTQDSDPLFATTRLWYCAVCAKDIGKYQGKLNKYRPWAVFPCKELSPQRSGGFGHTAYIDRLRQKRSMMAEEDQGLNKSHVPAVEKKKEDKKEEVNPQSTLLQEQSESFRQFYLGRRDPLMVKVHEQGRSTRVQSSARKTFRVKRNKQEPL